MATEVSAKRLKTSPPLIGTHNGPFHADEALAVYMLRLLPEYSSSALVRTRDPAVLATCHTVVDVGDEYDASRHRYDHHQRSFATAFPGHQTRLSSAGLVYMHFGKAIIAQYAKLPIDHPEVELLYIKLYDDFVEAIDANDNGISSYDTNALEAAGIRKKFKDSGFTLASIVGDLNGEDPLTLDQPSRTTPESPQAEEDYRFSQASKFMGTSFLRKLHRAATIWLPARTVVKEAFDNRLQNDPSGKILALPRGGIPWKDHLYSLEESAGLPDEQKLLYVLYPEKEAPGSAWRIQAVSVEAASFESRKPLPELWRGERYSSLDVILGNAVEDGANFVHANGFIGGHSTEAGARKMAAIAMNL